uniref:Death domain-containing protein n=2 Tax=Amphimedon queenslandica TaxID=400682 RepID=A0A1X7TC69_AMPQE
MACLNRNFETVQFLTNSTECSIEAEGNDRDRPLHLACASGNVDIVRHLVIDKHCDVNAKRNDGLTPLHMACLNQAESDLQNRPLHLACKSGNVDIVRHLVIDKHCDVNAKRYDGLTPLHMACLNHNFETVKFLTNSTKCNIEAEDNNQDRPLHLACRSGNVDIIRHLVIDKHCDVNAKRFNGYTPLHYACEKGPFEVFKILINHPQCNIEAGDKYSERPLHKAYKSGNVDIVHHLVIEKNCDVNAIWRYGNTLLHDACEKGNFEIVKILTSHPQCNIEAEDKYNRRPLHVAFSSKTSNSMDIVNYLVEVKGCTITDDNKIQKYFYIRQSSGIALLRVVKCILTGPPGAGKSTLKKRLLNQSLDTGPSLSTGVIDAAVQVNSFRKLSQHNAVVTTEWKEQELDEEAVLITKKLLPANNTSDESTRPTAPLETSVESTGIPQPMSVDETVDLTSSNEDKQESLKEFDLSPITSQQGNKNVSTSSPVYTEAAIDTVVIDESSIMEHENVPNSPAKIINCKEEENYVMKIPVRKRQEYEEKFEEGNDDNHTILHIIDTGGQPEFHEILPALITGPAINLLVFKLTEDLRSRYEIIYRTSAGDSKPYETSLTHEELKSVVSRIQKNLKMFYAGLEDIIITNLQLVFDRITNLITTCFTFEQLKSAAVRKEFRKNGRFSESQLDKISLREKGDPLNAKRLVTLLKHLYIVAGPMKTKVDRKTVNYYFMPCALKPADVESEERNGSVSPVPLLICFECGYTPVGVFCCLVVYLLDQKTDQVLEWKLTGNDQCRNKITFQVGKYHDIVTLISHATYLEVWVQQIKGSKLSKSDLCDKILSSLHKGLDTVTQSLHYTYKSKHEFGVLCTCTGVPHPAVIDSNEETTTCANGEMVELNEKQLYWSSKIVKLNDVIQNASSQMPPQTDSNQDCSKGSYLSKRSRAAQDENSKSYSSSKRIPTDDKGRQSQGTDSVTKKRKQNEDHSRSKMTVTTETQSYDTSEDISANKRQKLTDDTEMIDNEPVGCTSNNEIQLQDCLNVTLSIDDLDAVLELLSNSFNQWKTLGLKLGISYVTLDNIQSEEKKVQGRLMEMLATWLRKKDKVVNTTWSQLIDSLRKIGENALAEKIEAKITKQ